MRLRLNDAIVKRRNVDRVRARKQTARLPIGHAARIAFELHALRSRCCHAAELLTSRKQVNETELEECAQLDDALGDAHRQLKAVIRRIMISRIRRRTKAR